MASRIKSLRTKFVNRGIRFNPRTNQVIGSLPPRRACTRNAENTDGYSEDYLAILSQEWRDLRAMHMNCTRERAPDRTLIPTQLCIDTFHKHDQGSKNIERDLIIPWRHKLTNRQ